MLNSGNATTRVAHPCSLKLFRPRENEVSDDIFEPDFITTEEALDQPLEETSDPELVSMPEYDN